MLEKINIKTNCQRCLIDITKNIESTLPRKDGICLAFVPHTTAAITINEGTDENVALDILNHLQKLIPKSKSFLHFEGNSDAHIASSIIGTQLQLAIQGGKVVLGTWQRIFFAEFDGPRQRNIYIKFIEG